MASCDAVRLDFADGFGVRLDGRVVRFRVVGFVFKDDAQSTCRLV